MAGVQLNSVFLFSLSQAMSESLIFEKNKHFLPYYLLEAAPKWRTEFANHHVIISTIYLLIYHSRGVFSTKREKSRELAADLTIEIQTVSKVSREGVMRRFHE